MTVPKMRRRRRWPLVLIAAIAMLAGTAGWAVAWRPSIDPITLPDRVPPEDVDAPLRLCWLENAERAGSTVSALLVRHRQGDVLVDAGSSTQFAQEIEDYPLSTWLWLTLLPGQLRPTRSIEGHVRWGGADPARLRWVIPTHIHVDHAGGLVDLPDAPVLLAQEEIDLARELADDHVLHVIPAHARAIEGRTTPIPFELAPYETFDRSHDVFGDGSVVIVPMPGHTPGSVGVFITFAGRRIFHVGDVVHDDAGYLDRVAKPPLMRPTDHDPVAADRMVAHLAALHEAQPDLHILPAHSRPAWQALFDSEAPRCIDSRDVRAETP